MCSSLRTRLIRAASISFATSSTCADSKVAPPPSFNIPTRLITASMPLRSSPSTRGSCTLAVTISTVGKTPRCAACESARVGTRTQWPRLASCDTSSLPTNPDPPITQILSLGSMMFTTLRFLSRSVQGHQDDGVSAANLEYQGRCALRALAKLLQARHVRLIDADDDIIVAQARLRCGASGLDGAHQHASVVGRIDEVRSVEPRVGLDRFAHRESEIG